MEDRPGRGGPKYRQIADELRAEILAGHPPVGKQLATKSELQDRFGVAINTVERAIDVLRQEGYVESRQGAGMYVLTDEPAPDDIAALVKGLAEVTDEVRQLRERVVQLETLAEQVRQLQPGE